MTLTAEQAQRATIDLADARVAVLGAGGFIGQRCVRALLAAGAEVVMVARRPLERAGGNAARTNAAVNVADLASPGSVRRVLTEVSPHAVVNALGYGVGREERDEHLARRLNAELVEELADELVALESSLPAWPGQRLIHLGSAFEYGTVEGRVTEATECRPLTSYGATKLEGTRRLAAVVGRTGLRAITARLATVYGPGERPHRLLPSLIEAAMAEEPLSFTAGEQERDFTFVDDVAEGVARLLVARELPGPVLNLATGTLTTVRGFAERAREMLGIPHDRLRFGVLPYRPDEVWQGPIGISRLEAALGWKPRTSIDEGIRRTIAETGNAGNDPA